MYIITLCKLTPTSGSCYRALMLSHMCRLILPQTKLCGQSCEKHTFPTNRSRLTIPIRFSGNSQSNNSEKETVTDRSTFRLPASENIFKNRLKWLVNKTRVNSKDNNSQDTVDKQNEQEPPKLVVKSSKEAKEEQEPPKLVVKSSKEAQMKIPTKSVDNMSSLNDNEQFCITIVNNTNNGQKTKLPSFWINIIDGSQANNVEDLIQNITTATNNRAKVLMLDMNERGLGVKYPKSKFEVSSDQSETLHDTMPVTNEGTDSDEVTRSVRTTAISSTAHSATKTVASGAMGSTPNVQSPQSRKVGSSSTNVKPQSSARSISATAIPEQHLVQSSDSVIQDGHTCIPREKLLEDHDSKQVSGSSKCATGVNNDCPTLESEEKQCAENDESGDIKILGHSTCIPKVKNMPEDDIEILGGSECRAPEKREEESSDCKTNQFSDSSGFFVGLKKTLMMKAQSPNQINDQSNNK